MLTHTHLMVTTFFVLETWLMKYHALMQTPMEMRCLRKLGTMTHMLGHMAPCSKAVVPYGVNHGTKWVLSVVTSDIRLYMHNTVMS